MADSTTVRAQKSLQKEREKYWPKVKNGYVTQPKDDDPFLWHLYVKAPDEYSVNNEIRECPYKGKMFRITINYPENYPFGPPTMKFEDGYLYHPNIRVQDLMFEVATTDSISYFLRAESREEHRRWIKGLKELCQLRDYPVGRAVHGAPSPKKHHKGIDDKNLPISSKNEAVTSTTSDGVSSASLEGRARETSLQSDSSLSMKIGSRSDQIEVVADGEEDGNEIADAEFKDSESTDTTAFAGTKPPPAAISLSRLEEEDVHRLVSDDSKAKLHSIESAIKRRQQRSSTSGRSAIHPAEGAHSASPGQISGKGPSKARSKLFAKGLTPTKQKKIEPYRADSNFTHADWDDQKQSAGPPAFENYGEPSTNDEMYEDWDQDTSEQTQGKESKTGPNKNSEREVLNKNDDGTADSHTKWVSEPFDDDETTEEQDLQTPMKPSLRASNGDQNRNSPGVPADSDFIEADWDDE